MSLMLWFRKYNKRIMAFVVIALMIVFTIGPALDYLSARRSGVNRVVAHYKDNQKITSTDLAWAQKQLELLRMVGASAILRPQDPRYVPTQDLQTVLLGELLFAERATALETIGRIRQLVNRGSYEISDEQINDIYAREYSANIYWLMLTKEARSAGLRVPASAAREQLKLIIPRIVEGATYERAVSEIIRREGVSEEQVLETFGELMAVLEYGRTMSSILDRTSQQNLHEAAWNEQTIDAEYVLFDSGIFAEQARRPSGKQINEQFEKYKGYFAGDVNEDNPYGFGYKWPARIELEYIAVRLDDVAAAVARPTQQETEEFYQQHLSQSPIAYMAPSDPNDPNSQMVQKTRSYAEVAGTISRGLYLQRVDSKAEQILTEAKSITEVNLGEIEGEKIKLTDEQIKSRSVDYEKTAAQLSEKYKLKVYAGKTGLLSAADIESDPNLRMLYLGGSGYLNMGLSRMVFAVDKLKAGVLGPMDPRAPRLYENIGPLRDVYEMTEGYSGKNMMLVRIIEAEKAAEPASINEKINNRNVRFDWKGEAKDINTVKELVIDDLKRLAAMDKTGEKAGQFAQMAARDGWDTAIDKFNELYGDQTGKKDANTITKKGPFRLITRTGFRKVPEEVLFTYDIRRQGDPMARNIINRMKVEGILIDKLCSVLPDDANSLASAGAVVEIKPVMGYYCLKDLVVHLLYEGQYERIKARLIINNKFADAQSLAAVHYNPKNIMKRMNFSLVKEEQVMPREAAEENEPNVPVEPAGGEGTEKQ
jgi:hypothetical protein